MSRPDGDRLSSQPRWEESSVYRLGRKRTEKPCIKDEVLGGRGTRACVLGTGRGLRRLAGPLHFGLTVGQLLKAQSLRFARLTGRVAAAFTS